MKNPINAITSLFTKFPTVFWVVQSFELMERGAYYTMIPVLAVHFIYNVGIPMWLGLILTVFMYPFQYGMPVFTSALAEKVGYRKQMLVAFVLLTFGYLALSFAFDSITAVLSVILIGFGIGVYKPLVSSTIAKCTTQNDRNVAYSIYYWLVNLAAAIFPIIWTVLLFVGIMDETMYAWVFRLGSVFFLVNIVVVIFVFKEVPRSGEVKTIKHVLLNIKTAFVDVKFVVMVLLISGFWALYSITLAPFQTIMYGFHFLPSWFPVILLGVFNPLTIILAGIPLAKLVEKMESLKALMAGVAIYLIGLIIIGLFLENIVMVVGGIVIISIGEFMVAPGYLAFVSKLAPKEKVSAYIGCNFLASFVGIWSGALGFGLVTNFVAVDLERPHFFYGIVIAFGALILIGFMVYYKAWGQKIIDRAKEIREMEEGAATEEVVMKDWLVLRFFNFRASLIVPILLVPMVIIGSYYMGTNNYLGQSLGMPQDSLTPFSLDDYTVQEGPSASMTQTLQQGDSAIQVVNITASDGDLTMSTTFMLQWQDEPDQRHGLQMYENQPDMFKMTVEFNGVTKDVSGENQQDPNGGVGSLELTFTFEHDSADSTNGTGDYTVTIELVDAGDNTAKWVSPIKYTDDSNGYSLSWKSEIYTPLGDA